MPRGLGKVEECTILNMFHVHDLIFAASSSYINKAFLPSIQWYFDASVKARLRRLRRDELYTYNR